MKTWRVCCAIGVAVLVGAIWTATTGPSLAQSPCPAGKPSSPNPGAGFVPTANCEGWIPANHPDAPGQPTNTPDRMRINKGFEIAPVALNMTGLDRDMVGLGSWLVNGVGDCVGCHTADPDWEPGASPFLAQPRAIAKSRYLAGGQLFTPPVGNVLTRNLTPDAAGRPAGLTYDQFFQVIRQGTDWKLLSPQVPSASNDLLQVMPWPFFQSLLDSEIRAMYEYLRAIPPNPVGFPR